MPHRIQCAVNTHVVNKAQPNDKAAWKSLASDWTNVELSIEQFAAHINDGYAFCAKMLKRRTNANFIGTNIVTVDIDEGWTLDEALNDDFVKRYAAVVYTTASHTEQHNKFRIVFLLEREIIDARKMRTAYIGVIRKFGGDEACKDVCRLFFGSKGSNPIVFGNVLPNAELDKLLILGAEQRISDSDGDPDDTTKRAPVGHRSRVTLAWDLIIRLAKGGSTALQSAEARTAIYCPEHQDRTPSAMVVVNKSGKRGVFCSKCACTFWPDHPNRADRQPYDFTRVAEAVRELAHEDFPFHHDDLYNEDDEGNLIAPTEDDVAEWLRALAMRAHVKMFDKFLPDLALAPGVTFVRSPKGSGKTEQLKSIVQQCKEQGLSVLLIGHRQTLIHSMAARLGLTCYLSVEGGKQSNNDPESYYAVCLDSISKLLKPNLHSYDVVIIDESEQVFSHLTSDTLKSKRRHCFKMLCHYLKYARSLVLCDADLAQITNECVMQSVGADASYRFFLNDYRPPKRQFDLYEDSDHLTADMMAAIGGGGRHFVVSNSKRRATALYTAITTAYPDKKAILITSSQSSDDAVQYFINNIKLEVLNYDVVVASPSLGTGIDITFEEASQEIDTVFGFFVARVNTHFDIDQQLARVRHPRALKVWVTPERFNFETDPSAIEAELILCRNLNDMLEGYDRSGMPILDQSYLKVYSHVAAMQRASKNNLRHHFVQLRAQNGWEANVVERSKDAARIGSEQMETAKAQIEAAKIEAVINAAPITDQEYKLLIERQKTQTLNAADEHSLRHYELSTFYRASVDEDLIAFDNDGKLRNQIRLAEVYFGTKTLIVDRSLRLEDSQALPSDALNLPLKRELLRELLTSAGLVNDKHAIKIDVVITHSGLTDFVSTVRRNVRRIQELFDLAIRADLPKKPVQSLSAILELLGLQLIISADYKENGQRIREYQVDGGSLELVKSIIARRASTTPQSTPLIWPLPSGKKARKKCLPRQKKVKNENPIGKFGHPLSVLRQQPSDITGSEILQRLLALPRRAPIANETGITEVPHGQGIGWAANTSEYRANVEKQIAEVHTSFSPDEIKRRQDDRRAGPALAEIRAKHGVPAQSRYDPLRSVPSRRKKRDTAQSTTEV